MESDKVLKKIISEVNRTLPYYEKCFSSARRTPETYQERCNSFEEYVTNRFNFEASKVPEFEEIILKTDGHVFKCVELEDADEKKRRFKRAVVVFDDDLLQIDDQSLKDEITRIKEYIGGDRILFNSVKKKIKLIVKNNDN